MELIGEVKALDIDKNGFVTSSELNRIFTDIYEKEMEGKRMVKYLRKFSSVQNRVMINYRIFFKQLLDAVDKEIKKVSNIPTPVVSPTKLLLSPVKTDGTNQWETQSNRSVFSQMSKRSRTPGRQQMITDLI